ncbi:MAG: HEPN domain-containing protein [Deltaproteobacteria bacterium]|jgi:HEPN domain-containing protein
MTTPHEINAEVRRWVEKAENDFRNAEYVLTLKENCPFDTVSYHCQQCAEKYLKALLIYRNVDFPKTHDLVVLFNLLQKVGHLKFSIEAVQPLNRYATETRYPGDWESIGESEAREAFEMVCAVRDTVRNALSSIIWN